MKHFSYLTQCTCYTHMHKVFKQLCSHVVQGVPTTKSGAESTGPCASSRLKRVFMAWLKQWIGIYKIHNSADIYLETELGSCVKRKDVNCLEVSGMRQIT